MKQQKSDRPTYPELLKFYYSNFPDLGLAAHSIGLAIIHKSNELFFPESFKMSNTELNLLSKVRLSNIGRSRQNLIDNTKVDTTPLFTYISNGQRKAGTYKINFFLTSLKLHLNFIKTSFSAPQDNDPNPTKQNLTILDGLGAGSQEFEKANERLVAYKVNAAQKLLDIYPQEWINFNIDCFEESYQNTQNMIRDPAAIIVSMIQNPKSYEMWQKGMY